MASTLGHGRGPTAEQVVQVNDAAVQSVCRPADVAQISFWARGHTAGGQTDIDGYSLTITVASRVVFLTIVRSRP